MMQLIIPIPDSQKAMRLPSGLIERGEEEFFRFCQANRDLRIERSAEGEIIVMSPAGGYSSFQNNAVASQLYEWAQRDGSGKAFDSSANDFPPDFTLVKVEGPRLNVSILNINELPVDWRLRLEVTRDLGTAWLRRRESVLLQVPSAIVPETSNFLFNPNHRDAKKFRITAVFSYPFDTRLKS